MNIWEKGGGVTPIQKVSGKKAQQFSEAMLPECRHRRAPSTLTTTLLFSNPKCRPFHHRHHCKKGMDLGNNTQGIWLLVSDTLQSYFCI